jgi:translation initiation factor IF-2
MLEPTFAEVIDGRAEVRAVFSAGKGKNVAGVYVTEGKATRNASVRIHRGQEVIGESTVNSLKRFKDNAREVAAGYECGLGIANFHDYQVGDILEFFSLEATNR